MVDEGVLTTEEIARVAGVARGTVADWRRRHADFPAPVSGTGRGQVFSRAEVEAWLAGAGRWELAPHARLWREVNHAARGASLGHVIAAVTGQPQENHLPPTLAWVTERAVDEAGTVAVVSDLIDRYWAASGYYVTPARIAELVAGLAAPGEDTTVLDPACGTGELLAAALAQGAGRVIAQDASTEALAKARLLPSESQHAEVDSDASAAVEADVVLCRPPLPADGSEPELGWAQRALAHLKPGGLAILLLPSTAATSPAGAQIRADLLREGSLRAVIELPLFAGWPYNGPPHLWVLRRSDAEADPDLRALFAEPRPDLRPGPDETVSPASFEEMSTAQWRAFSHSVQSAWERMNDPERRTTSSGGGRNVHHCVTRVADLLDDALLDEPERLGETFGITPGRVKAHYSALCRVREAQRAASTPKPVNPTRSFSHARLCLSMIPVDVDGITKTLKHFDWLDAPDIRKAARRPAVWPPKAAHPADPWRTATIPELARLGMLRYRLAGSAHAELLRTGDVVVPTALTENAIATVVDKEQEGSPAGPHAHLIRPNPAHLDPWFLVGFLTASATGQLAAIDLRQLEVPLLSLENQEPYATAFRRLRYLKAASARLTSKVTSLRSTRLTHP
jgi:SAM-dependent methyltransferase/predicted DNA-binding transcriptional regulator AlpA